MASNEFVAEKYIKAAYMVDVFEDNKPTFYQKLYNIRLPVRIIVYNDQEYGQGRWNFYFKDLPYVQKLIFVMKTILARLRDFMDATLTGPYYVISRSRDRIYDLVSNLQGLDFPDSYDYYGEEAQCQQKRFQFKGVRFPIRYGPESDLKYFVSKTIIMLDEILNGNIETVNQCVEHVARYNSYVLEWVSDLENMCIFENIGEAFRIDRYLTLNRSYSDIVRNGLRNDFRHRKNLINKYYTPFSKTDVDNFIMKKFK